MPRASIKTYRRGAHLAVEPEKTLSRVKPWMGSMGITRIANVTGLDRLGIPVVMVCRPNSRSVAVSQGKGLTLSAAKASGLMESVESWHAERIELPLKLASFTELKQNHDIIDLDRLPKLSGSHFHVQRPLLWIEGIEAIGGDHLWMPYELIHTRYHFPPLTGGGCFAQSSNGLASGNEYLEAVSHAICECVERDASSLWHQQKNSAQQRSRVDLASVDDAECRTLIDQLAQADIETVIWCITSDTGIPTFECLLLDSLDPQAHCGHGAGCHPSKSIALMRAITESAQVRTTYIAGSRDDLEHDEYTLQHRLARKQAFCDLIDPDLAPVDFSALDSFEFESFDEDVDWLKFRLSAIGITQIAIVDLSRVEIGIPVVRVVIPGLEGPHDDDDYVPGARTLVGSS